MPELPELEIVKEVLRRRVVGRRIRQVSFSGKGGPIVARDLIGAGFREGLQGTVIQAIKRRGKFLLFGLNPRPRILVVNPKLTGRLQLSPPGGKKAGPVHVTLHLEGVEQELRYVDQKRMGQLYLTDDLSRVPTFDQLGPEPLQVSPDEFGERLRHFRGEIKGVLSREQFLAGIGNAYADEILWQARIHPYRKSASLTPAEIEALYLAIRTTLLESIDKVRKAMGEEVHLKPRDFFAVHMRGGKPCPRCGTRISDIRAHQRITNFCRACQPGGLIRGM
ncbi:MAG TPA: DNA-formamidopyrimidine glycosylase family protein [Anaerolineales bacterium]